MQNLTEDTIGGYNSYIEAQKNSDTGTKLTTILFDDKYEILHDGLDINNVPTLTKKEYYARGSTALLDAIGKTINTVTNRLSKLDKGSLPSKVLFVVTTDGYENSSKEYNNNQLKEMIDKHTKDDGWQFIFLGANIDSFSVANSIGINTSINYSATVDGTRSVYSGMVCATNSYMNTGILGEDWKKEIK
jgi:hypothetical protein